MWNTKPIIDSRYSELFSDKYDNVRELHEQLVKLEVDSIVQNTKTAYEVLFWTWTSIIIALCMLILITASYDQQVKDVQRDVDYVDAKLEFMTQYGREKGKKYDV